MGQYYEIIVGGAKSGYKVYEPCDGFKLCEFSYYGSTTTEFIGKLLYENPMQLGIIGDYATLKDCATPVQADLYTAWQKSKNEEPIKEDSKGLKLEGKIAVNFTKGCYIELAKTQECEYNPIFILCALGNGYGGGDYSGPNEEHAGEWFGDIIGIYDTKKFGDEFERKEFKFWEEF